MANPVAANATSVAAEAANRTLSGGPGFDTGTSIATTAAWLCFLLAVIFLAYWLLKRYGPKAIAGGGRGNLQLEDRVMVGNQQSVCVVTYKDRRFLIGATGQNIRLLADLDRTALTDFEEALATSMSDNEA